MTRPTSRKKTALELAEERRLAAMSPEDRARLDAARRQLRARADAALGDRRVGVKPHRPLDEVRATRTDPEAVAHDLEELL